jgi:cytidylate kinase
MLGFDYLDTGAMYRTAALLAHRNSIDPSEGDALCGILPMHDIVVDSGGVLLDGEDVSEAIRSTESGEAASRISSSPSVRKAMVSLQRRFAENRRVVAEGRDMGTVVFPGADLKIYIIADIAVRGTRRTRELRRSGGVTQLEFAGVVEGLLRRDRRDRERADSPLRPAPDAVWLDTSLMTIGEQVDRVVSLYRTCGGVSSR